MWGYVIDSTLSNDKNEKNFSTLESLEFCRKLIEVKDRDDPKYAVRSIFYAESESETRLLLQAAAWQLWQVLDHAF